MAQTQICSAGVAGAHLEEHELAAQGGLIHVHERGQLGQGDGGVELEQLLEAGQVLLLLHHALEAAQLQPVCFLYQHQDNLCQLCLATQPGAKGALVLMHYSW